MSIDNETDLILAGANTPLHPSVLAAAARFIRRHDPFPDDHTSVAEAAWCFDYLWALLDERRESTLAMPKSEGTE